ncbi:MAG TPA: helix-turn-helix domain-containing protein [Terracidiphilus sp.]|jgi:DNA-binding HxlR family transcriptional regulator|nr:helix-turn-helix domain-containing protein [Terracidiphilus sp.]
MDTVRPPYSEILKNPSWQFGREILDLIADKWTLLVIEVLSEARELRFTRLQEQVGGISQKMLTKTLRQMERYGLVTRHVHPVIPPHVDYRITKLGESLGEAVCGIWKWKETNQARVTAAREAFDAKQKSAQRPSAKD